MKQFITGLGQISHLGQNVKMALETLRTSGPDKLLSLSPEHLESEASPDMEMDLSQDLPKGDHIRANILSILAIEEAIAQAGLTSEDISKYRIGVCVGSTSACTISYPPFGFALHRGTLEDTTPFKNYFFNSPCNTIMDHFKFKGPSLMINNACTSGTDAIGLGKLWLAQGKCDIVIAGGVDCIFENIYFGFRSLKLTAPKHTKPFDQSREGLVLGEGAGYVVLENEVIAAERKSKPLAIVAGYGLGTDSHHPTTPHPEARGLNIAINHALKMSSLTHSDIELVNAHATGTEANDLVEGRFLKKHFDHCPIFATKGYTGHTLGAAGAIEVIIGVLCLREEFVPSSLGHENCDPEIGLSPNLEFKNHQARNFLSTSLGFGGSNAAIIIENIEECV
ncbi:hypothetical protein A9Q84_05490 [Halobacteriovorax marinus]|uniref:Ketosynthase family 3 (KS3) domain-containing protein n=1 Tax=Halobacteriovorax marinus TaxID=97084 RepID=A0A1Y5FB84_9BACT|nr:hypothetical protein A9Q84_05490 [Halobacteriovorax marinus]